MNMLANRDHSIQALFWKRWLVKNVHILVPHYVIGDYTADFAHLPTKTLLEFHRLAQETTRDQVKRDGWQIVPIQQRDIERGIETIVQKIGAHITNKTTHLQKKVVQAPSSLPTVENRRSVAYSSLPIRSYASPVPSVPLSACRICRGELSSYARDQLCSVCATQERYQQQWATVLAETRAMMRRDDWVVIDTETTGVTKTAEIIDIALINSQGVVVLDTLVKPQQHIPSSASRVHGIFEKDVMKAPTLRELWPRLLPYVQHGTILAYNAQFDMRMLAQTAQQYRLEYPQNPQSMCVMKMYLAYLRTMSGGSSQPYSLEKACEQLSIQPGQHRALGDARAAWEVLKKLSEQE